ncbi:MAG TPA: hypothetical protein VK518_23875 [Puia sp.]|nr:hypothetical protein [Puia sp.]
MEIGSAKDCIAEQAGTIAGYWGMTAAQPVDGQPGDTFSGLTDLPCLFNVYPGDDFDGGLALNKRFFMKPKKIKAQQKRKMRTLYTILFFADTLLLICLSYLFLRELDDGGAIGALVLIFPGMIASIFLLVVLLKSYVNQTSDKEQR